MNDIISSSNLMLNMLDRQEYCIQWEMLFESKLQVSLI